MPGTKYTEKQERKADHIEQSYKEKGLSKDEAKARAWATVNKQDGGGKKPGGSGRAANATKAAPTTNASPSAQSASKKAPTSDRTNRPGKSSPKSTSTKKN